MNDFLNTLISPDFPFLRYALLTGLLSAIPLGMAGTYAVVLRISYLAGAIAHAVLGGIGFALYLKEQYQLEWLNPIYGAIFAAFLTSQIIAWTHSKAAEREDTIIGTVWAGGMAIGLLFFSITPGYNEPSSYLFGNILMTGPQDLWIASLLSITAICCLLLFENELTAVCFDREFAKLQGINAEKIYRYLLGFISITIVALLPIAGILLVVALLTIPAAIASMIAKSLRQTILLSIVFCEFFVFAGISSSYCLDLPSGSIIVLLAVSTYIFSIFIKHLKT